MNSYIGLVKSQKSIIIRLFYLLFFIAFFISCLNNSFSNKKKFFKCFQETLKNNRIVKFNLSRNADLEPSGSIIYCAIDDSEKKRSEILEGTISPNGYFEFRDYYPNNNKILLSGNFTSDSEIEIHYLDTSSNQIFEMNLMELKDKFVISAF